MIVDDGRKVLTHLLAEADAGYKVSKIVLGTKGHDLLTGNILNPIPPQLTDHALVDTTDVFARDIDINFQYQGVSPQDSSVMFSAVMEKTDANGSTGTTAYTEAGLLTANNTLFARETFPAIVKNANRKITFQWVILF